MEILRHLKKIPFLLILPGLLILIIAIAVPLVLSFYYSLMNWSGFGKMKLIGLENFNQLLFHDPTFWGSLTNALILAAVTIFIQNPLAFILAAVLSKLTKGAQFFKTVYFIPAVLSVVVISQMWVHIFSPNYGILNKILHGVGLGQFAIGWLSNPHTALGAVIFIIVWQGFGWALLFYFAGLSTVPKEIEEAAMIDGASTLQLYTRIVIPYIMPVISAVAIIAIISCLKQMEIVYLTTQGGPGDATQFIANYLYIKAFKYSEYGYGNAISVLFFFISILLTVATNRLTKREGFND